jgi:hypothetical protein
LLPALREPMISTLMHDPPFLGEWRQVRPITRPTEIVVRFEPDGLVVYSVDNQLLHLTWRLDGDTLVVNDEQRSRFWFRSESVLVLERDDERYVYYRV